MPVKWGFDYQSRVAAALGFDAEHPVIKSEMSQILKIRQRVNKRVTAANPLMNNILKLDSIPDETVDIKMVDDNYLRKVKIPLKVGWILLIVSGAIVLIIVIIRKRR